MTGKAVMDWGISIIGLIVLSPVFFILAILIKVDSHGPVFFKQIRIGQFGRQFRIIKFRTMVTDAERLGPQVSSGDDGRITRIGKILRRHKLDELPQLLNVARGEMSLVGPRPEVPKYVALYQDDFDEILAVKPGITDYASIVYRHENELLKSAEEPEKKYVEEILPVKLGYNKRYLRERCLATDVGLIVKTLLKVAGS